MFTGRKDADVKNAKSTPASNTAAVITIDEGPGQHCHLARIVFSYSGTPTGGRLTVSVNGTTRFDTDITAGGPGPLGLNIRGLKPIVITLAAGGVGVTGKLYAEYFDQ